MKKGGVLVAESRKLRPDASERDRALSDEFREAANAGYLQPGLYSNEYGLSLGEPPMPGGGLDEYQQLYQQFRANEFYDVVLIARRGDK